MRTTALLACVLLSACAEESSLEPGCPCAEGYTCCPDDTCVPEGESCGLPGEDEARNVGQGLCRDTTDVGLDGTIDREGTYTYSGNTEIYESDDDLDGVSDSRMITEYDREGRWLWLGYDEDLDGLEDLVMSESYDAFGRRSVSETIRTDDPALDRRKTRIYTGPAPIEQTDHRRDGLIDRITTVILDEEQRIIRRETDVADEAGAFDGTSDWFIDYTHGPHGVVEQRSYAPGQPPSMIMTFEYDAAGRRSVDRWDLEGDGVFDEVRTATYDAQGRYATWTIENVQAPELGERWSYHYDCE